MNPNLSNILFLDIETVGLAPDFESLDERIAEHWVKKSSIFKDSADHTPSEMFMDKAGIYAEFGKIITIAVGFFVIENDRITNLRIKALASHDEEQLLSDFKNLIESMEARWGKDKLLLCAHNGKEFDFPFLCRRMLVNGITLPYSLDISGKKPWEVNHLDTMEMWKFGDRKSFTSLDLLASIFDLDSSKEDIDGSMVHQVYYESNNIEKIAKYCMQDVSVTAQVYLKLNTLPTLTDEQIQYLPLEIEKH